jgi:hypothetical protein
MLAGGTSALITRDDKSRDHSSEEEENLEEEQSVYVLHVYLLTFRVIHLT